MQAARRDAHPRDPLEGELVQLKNEYDAIAVNRKTFSEDSTNTIRMQRHQISKLKKDNDRLREDLALETRQAKQANNMSATEQIAKLQDQADIYSRKIDVERSNIDHLEKQIHSLEITILEQKKDMGGINASRERNKQVFKQIRILENRLDKALVKYNEALAQNRQLRVKIENLRRERIVFEGIYRKLERELHERKNKMAQIIEISNQAYSARDKAQAEMIALKAEADKKQTKFEMEWSQLGQLIEKDKRSKDFNKKNDREWGGEGQLEQEKSLRKKVEEGAKGVDRDKRNIHHSMEKVQSYEEAFNKLQEATKITDVDELVQAFLHAEDTNFSLFNYVNDLTSQIETLEESIHESEKELDKYTDTGVTADKQRKRILGRIDTELHVVEEQQQQIVAKRGDAEVTVTSLKTGVSSVFDKIGCSDPVVRATLGDAGITERNMMSYLGIIETRAHELLEVYRTQQEKHHEEKAVAKTLKQTAIADDSVAEDVAGEHGYEEDAGFEEESTPQPV